MTNKWSVRITSGMSMFTAYEGEGRNMASRHCDTARNVLVMTKGTATVELRERDALREVWKVTDGEFTSQTFDGKPVKSSGERETLSQRLARQPLVHA